MLSFALTTKIFMQNINKIIILIIIFFIIYTTYSIKNSNTKKRKYQHTFFGSIINSVGEKNH